MMKKINSSKLSTLKLMVIIPIALLAVYLVSCSKDQNTDNGLNTDSKEVKSATEEIAPPPPPPPLVTDQDKGTNENEPIVEEKFESFAINEKPEFPGGDEAFKKYIAENTVYPKETLEKGIEGTVYLRFVITKNGKVGEIKVLRKVDLKLLGEAIRVVSSMPEWKPGMKDGKPVNVWFIVPVKFIL